MNTSLNRIILVTLVTGSLLLSSCGKGHEESIEKTVAPVVVTIAEATSQNKASVEVSGVITAGETAIISTRIMGFVTQLPVKPGDRVERGQLLATISNGDILAKRAQAQAMVSEADAALKDAAKDYERFEKLYEQQSASTKEFENMKLRYESVKAKADAAQQMLKEAEAMLVYTNLTSPFAGVVTQTKIDVGSMANPGMPLVVVEQQGKYQVTASVSEKEIASIHQHADAVIMIKSTGSIMKGKVSEVSPSSQNSGGQYLIKVDFAEAESAGLFSGMSVRVTIPIEGSKALSTSTVVPATAIIYRDQLTGIYTLSQNNTALLRWVKLGKVYGNDVEVLSGLRASEKYILEAQGKLFNGTPVTIR